MSPLTQYLNYRSACDDESESDNDDDVVYQLCESEPVVERAQAKSTCKSKKSLLLQSDRQQLSKSSGSAKALKKSQDKQSKASDLCSRQSHGRKDVQVQPSHRCPSWRDVLLVIS